MFHGRFHTKHNLTTVAYLYLLTVDKPVVRINDEEIVSINVKIMLFYALNFNHEKELNIS
jgi:hypothetical protein